MLSKWANVWSTELNFIKCKVMYIGRNRVKMEYFISNSDGTFVLRETDEEKDLGK